MRKLIKRRKKEIKFIQNRLDFFGDDWRNAPVEEDIKPDIKPIFLASQIKIEKGGWVFFYINKKVKLYSSDFSKNRAYRKN